MRIKPLNLLNDSDSYAKRAAEAACICDLLRRSIPINYTGILLQLNPDSITRYSQHRHR